MKTYKKYITLNKNSRGCYILDTIKGCCTCLQNNLMGCYGECYACKIAKRYRFDFSKSIIRDFKYDDKQLFFCGFKDLTHTNKIVNQIRKADMPFIRIGEMGDPSENWEHTIGICKEIYNYGKKIVIVTKHWKKIPDKLLKDIERMGLCINTSISALDNDEQIDDRLNEFHRLKNVCNSVLRIVSCDFNKQNEQGLHLAIIQEELFKNSKNIDTIFRPSVKNELVLKKIIKVERVKFLNSYCYASVFNKNTYLGYCNKCPDKCGIEIKH